MVERPLSRRRSAPRRRVLLDLWPLALALLLLLPAYAASGHFLARDLVWVPRQPWTDAGLGLGDTAPRAVPLDAVVSALTVLVDGGVLARIALPLVLAAAGWGAHRLLPTGGTVPRLLVGGFAVWNPFVVERLALGQWALLAGYAALPWVAAAAVRWRRGGERRDLASVVAWLAVASLTPTGGLLALATATVLGLGRPPRSLVPVVAGVVLQLPWLLPGLLGSAGATSDPDGVAAFAARAEGPGGALVAVLGLGGIWDAGSVPASRETAWGLVAAAVTLLAVAAGAKGLRTAWGGATLARAGVLALGGLVLALLSTTAPGADLVRWAVAEVPGAGLLRDAQKWVAPLALLMACALGAAAEELRPRVSRLGVEVAGPLGVVGVLLPLVLLPDATRATWPTVEPVRFPSTLDRVAEAVAADPDDVVTLPWRSYRRFDWGNGALSSDPGPRLLDADVVVDDTLLVGDTEVAGESLRVRRIDEALASGPPAEVLGEQGVGWVLVWRDDPEADALDLTGLDEVVASAEVALLRVPEPVEEPDTPDAGVRATVLAGHGLALLVALAGLAGAVRGHLTRLVSRKRGSHRLR